MMVFGYAKGSYYTGDSTLMVKVRIPSIHGPYDQADAKGQTIRNYVEDANLPEYQSLLLSQKIHEGDVVVLASTNNSSSNPDFIVIGLTGASYASGSRL